MACLPGGGSWRDVLGPVFYSPGLPLVDLIGHLWCTCVCAGFLLWHWFGFSLCLPLYNALPLICCKWLYFPLVGSYCVWFSQLVVLYCVYYSMFGTSLRPVNVGTRAKLSIQGYVILQVLFSF